MNSVNISELSKKLKSNNVEMLRIDIVDYGGFIRTKAEDINELEEILEHGTTMASAIMNFTPMGILSPYGRLGVSAEDVILYPDINTITIVPPYAFTLGNLYTKEGKPWIHDIRRRLQDTLLKVKEEYGFDIKTAFEIEFYITKNYKPISDVSCYELNGYYSDNIDSILLQLKRTFYNIGIKIEKILKECGSSQYEFNLPHSNPLKTADNFVLFKDITKMILSRSGYEANFMPKPFNNIPGSGLHLNISIWKNEKNLFYDEQSNYYLSEVAKHFIGGILEHAKALTAIAAPSVNSYKRLVRIPDMWAPVKIAYGNNNRSTILRIPTPRPTSRNNDLRVEYRVPDPSVNPYLLLTAVIEAGIDGIERKLEPGEPIDENAYIRNDIQEIPRNLREALTELNRDSILIERIGKDIIKEYTAVKYTEIEEFEKIVTDWEFSIYKNV